MGGELLDDLFDSGVNTTKANTMLCDIRETENTYEMNIALPGYKKEDIALELDVYKRQSQKYSLEKKRKNG